MVSMKRHFSSTIRNAKAGLFRGDRKDSIRLGIERKFQPTERSIANLNTNGGKPRLSNFYKKPEIKLEDTYYDREDMLSGKGVWLRYRRHVTGNWCEAAGYELKVRKAGTITRSVFEQITDPEEINKVLGGITSVDGPRYSQTTKFRSGGVIRLLQEVHNLDVLAKFITCHHTWRADGRFNIVIDKTNLGHCFGEVELMAEVDHDLPDKQVLMKCYQKELDEWMAEYAWAFPGPDDQVLGKLGTYLKLKDYDQFWSQ